MLVTSVHGSKIVNNPNNKAVKTCIIYVSLKKSAAKLQKYFDICKFFCTFAAAKVLEYKLTHIYERKLS